MSHFVKDDTTIKLGVEPVSKNLKDIISIAGCCLDNGDSAFKSKLKAYKRIH